MVISFTWGAAGVCVGVGVTVGDGVAVGVGVDGSVGVGVGVAVGVGVGVGVEVEVGVCVGVKVGVGVESPPAHATRITMDPSNVASRKEFFIGSIRFKAVKSRLPEYTSTATDK